VIFGLLGIQTLSIKKSGLQSIVAGAVEYLERVGQELCKGVEGFDGAFGAAWEIEDQGNIAHDRNATG
jgi:hypothetical protein